MIQKAFQAIYFVLVLLSALSCKNEKPIEQTIFTDNRIISYELKPEDKVEFFLKDEDGSFFYDFEKLVKKMKRDEIEIKFAFNGGMYNKNHTPKGLYIEKGKEIMQIDTLKEGFGNFYMYPNGVFYIKKDGIAKVVESSKFNKSKQIEYATQSGPMLVIENEIHPKFVDGSTNLNIRNGVGILPNGKALSAISNTEINLYDFAQFFKSNGCRNALYLDGFVSKVYYPPNYNQKGGKFGVLIAVHE